VGANAPTQIEALRKLGLSEDEIADVIATDKEIDKGAKLFELAPELQAGAKKARQADRTDTPKPRERKPNEDKRNLLGQMVNTIQDDFPCVACEIINPEREFLFTYNGIKYKVVLSAPRK
jgi:hypothetical protein